MNLDLIQSLFQFNLTVIPLKPRSKRPIYDGWRERTPADNNINEFLGAPARNVGVALGAPSGNVIDIDLDQPTPRQLAHYFLPPTAWIFGRPTAPRSHWLYRVKGDAGLTEQFENLAGKMVLEYRATGSQTVFPPSIHRETGEPIEFDEFDKIGEATRAELLMGCKCIFLVALLAPVYPEKGNRHNFALALSGTLINADWPPAIILQVLDALCDLTGDTEEKKNRLEAVETTLARKRANQPFTQWNQLKAFIGQDLAELIIDKVLGPNTARLGMTLRDDERNDSGIAKIFVAYAKERVIFVPELNHFFTCEEGIWHPDPYKYRTQEIFDRFIQAEIDRMSNDNPELWKADKKFFTLYRSRQHAQNAIKQAIPSLEISIRALDSYPESIALKNGLYNFKLGTLEPFRPDHYITKRSDVPLDPSADCPRFKLFMAETFCSDEDLIQYMKILMGYFMTGNVERHAARQSR